MSVLQATFYYFSSHIKNFYIGFPKSYIMLVIHFWETKIESLSFIETIFDNVNREQITQFRLG